MLSAGSQECRDRRSQTRPDPAAAQLHLMGSTAGGWHSPSANKHADFAPHLRKHRHKAQSRVPHHNRKHGVGELHKRHSQ